MRRARRARAARARVGDGVRLRRLLRLRRADARRLRAAVRRRAGARRGGPWRRWAEWPSRFCGLSLAHPIVNASGTFDAIAARRAFGDALLRATSRSPPSSPRRSRSRRARATRRRGCGSSGAGMINSIGLPNKGLEGYLAHDLPELAALPVPLIVNVMGSSAEDVATLVRAFGERDEVAALELNVSCPNVKTGLLMGADPGETAALLDAVRPRTAKPIDREADAELHVAGRGGGGRGGPRRRRRLAHQHGPRDGDGPAAAGASRGSAAAPAACRVRPSARWRSRRCARSAPGSRSRSSGWAACSADVMLKTCSTRARTSSRSARSRSAIRVQGRGSQKSSQSAGILRHTLQPARRAHSTRRLKNACKPRRYRQVP